MNIRLTFIFLLSLTLFKVGNAQMTPSQAKKAFPFLQTEYVDLLHFGDTQPAEFFFNKMEELAFCGQGKLHIAHFGGSHVQAGTIVQQLRRNLNTQYPQNLGAPGFIFPFHLAKTNNPSYYRIESSATWESSRAAKPSDQDSWGLASMVVKTRDTSGYIRIIPKTEDGSWGVNSIKIFGPQADSTFYWFVDSSYAPVRYEYDSVQQVFTITLEKPVREIVIQWKKCEDKQRLLYLDGFLLENDQPGLRYHLLGANGNSTESILRSKRAFYQLPSLPADLAIFGIGINDAHKSPEAFKAFTYKNNYRVLLDSLRQINPNVAFLFITNNDSYYHKKPNPNALAVQKAMRELAEEYGGYIFDLYEFMGGANASSVWSKYGLGKRDHIHFTPAGYALQADMMYEGIRQEFFSHLRKKYANNSGL